MKEWCSLINACTSAAILVLLLYMFAFMTELWCALSTSRAALATYTLLLLYTSALITASMLIFSLRGSCSVQIMRLFIVTFLVLVVPEAGLVLLSALKHHTEDEGLCSSLGLALWTLRAPLAVLTMIGVHSLLKSFETFDPPENTFWPIKKDLEPVSPMKLRRSHSFSHMGYVDHTKNLTQFDTNCLGLVLTQESLASSKSWSRSMSSLGPEIASDPWWSEFPANKYSSSFLTRSHSMVNLGSFDEEGIVRSSVGPFWLSKTQQDVDDYCDVAL